MGGHRRMGNVEQHLGNATPIISLHYQLSDTWRSPRGTVLRIEGLALVAIVCSFFLVSFGSCRRWSNSWIIQKGFLAAQVVSLSLGTYSIGLMQSSSVKSEMYPIWAVSLLTLFGCLDPVTSYIGLEYKGPLLKTIFQLCLYFGYVLLMSVSTISGGVGKLAIGVLSVITFIKGFHMSMAFVHPSSTRGELGITLGVRADAEPHGLAGEGEGLDVPLHVRQLVGTGRRRSRLYETRITTSMADIHLSCEEMLSVLRLKEVTANGIEDVCLGFSLSHFLRRHFLGLDTSMDMELKIKEFGRISRAIDYKRTLKAIEVELAFLYEMFFTSNWFLHYDEAKTSSFWAFASFVGICFVGVATAIPGAMSSRHHITGSNNSPGADTTIVNTTRADTIITLVILVSLALLQLVQLIRCWTSNWARVAFAGECALNRKRQASTTADPESCEQISSNSKEKQISWWVRLKAYIVTRMNWFDKYLWQDKIGQYSLVDEAVSSTRLCPQDCCRMWPTLCRPACIFWTCCRLPRMFGMQYIVRVVRELLACDTSTAIRLHDDVKASIADFLGKIRSRRIGVEWSSLLVDNGIDLACLPYSAVPLRHPMYDTTMSDAYAFSHRVMIWHVATRYCELADSQEESAGGGGGGGGGGGSSDGTREKNRRVAMALSRYCAYLVVSVPELLPGPSVEAKSVHMAARSDTWLSLWMPSTTAASEAAATSTTTLLQAMRQHSHQLVENSIFRAGVHWGMRLLNERPPPPECTPRRRSDDHWEVLALLWVQTLLYAAPSGDVQRHMQRLSQGGEFITHLWALLYHIGIDRWDRTAGAAAGETMEAEAHVQGDANEVEIQEIN